MKPKPLVLFVSSFQFHAGEDLVCAVVAAKATRYARQVLVAWSEEAHDPSKEIILGKFHAATIPAGQRSVTFALKTNRSSFGQVRLLATLEDGKIAEPQEVEVLRANIFQKEESIPILISLIAKHDVDDTRIDLPNSLANPLDINTAVRITVTEDRDDTGGVAAHFASKFLHTDVPVTKVNSVTGERLAAQPGNAALLSIPIAPFIPGGEDSNSFTFRLNANSLLPGTYRVDISVSIHAEDNANTYNGTQPSFLYFVKH